MLIKQLEKPFAGYSHLSRIFLAPKYIYKVKKQKKERKKERKKKQKKQKENAALENILIIITWKLTNQSDVSIFHILYLLANTCSKSNITTTKESLDIAVVSLR